MIASSARMPLGDVSARREPADAGEVATQRGTGGDPTVVAGGAGGVQRSAWILKVRSPVRGWDGRLRHAVPPRSGTPATS